MIALMILTTTLLIVLSKIKKRDQQWSLSNIALFILENLNFITIFLVYAVLDKNVDNKKRNICTYIPQIEKIVNFIP